MPLAKTRSGEELPQVGRDANQVHLACLKMLQARMNGRPDDLGASPCYTALMANARALPNPSVFFEWSQRADRISLLASNGHFGARDPGAGVLGGIGATRHPAGCGHRRAKSPQPVAYATVGLDDGAVWWLHGVGGGQSDADGGCRARRRASDGIVPGQRAHGGQFLPVNGSVTVGRAGTDRSDQPLSEPQNPDQHGTCDRGGKDFQYNHARGRAGVGSARESAVGSLERPIHRRDRGQPATRSM